MRTFAKAEDAWVRPAETWIIRAITPILCRRPKNYERPDGGTTGNASQSAWFAHPQREKSKYVERETTRRLYYPQNVITQARTSLLSTTPAVWRGGPNGCCVLRSSFSGFVALGISQCFVLSLPRSATNRALANSFQISPPGGCLAPGLALGPNIASPEKSGPT